MNKDDGKRIKILANHLGYVSIEPHIEGSWDAAVLANLLVVQNTYVKTRSGPNIFSIEVLIVEK